MSNTHDHHEEQHNHHDHHEHHDHEGHGSGGSHHHHHHGNFKELFLKSLPIGVLIMLMSPFMGLTETGLIHFPYVDIVVAVLATILLVYGGKPFYQGAFQEFKDRSPSMMALVSLGITVSYAYSIFAVIARYVADMAVMDYFFEFASLILIMLLGHWLEMKAVGRAGDAQQSLAELLPKDAQVVQDDGSVENVPVADLEIGDQVRVQAGENIPADGDILEGESRVNEALLTGESKPTKKGEGDSVIGGSTNGDGTLLVEVTETGDQSFISQVQGLVDEAQSQSSRAENLAGKIASWLFYIAVAAAVLAFIIWLAQEDLQAAISFTVATLVIACPHALGLAIPLVVARSTSLAAQNGLLVKDREAYELITKADRMILDKTGTLTTGDFKVLQVDLLSDQYSEDELLALLAGIEKGSSHPIAQAIVSHAEEQGLSPASFQDTSVISGEGVEGTVDGKSYKLISQKAYGQDLDVDVPNNATLSVLTEDGQAIGTVALGDELKDSSKELINNLKEHGIKPIMATGDNEQAAKAVASDLGIDYMANQSPEDKHQLVEDLKDKGHTVIMVGDGINDAPSLALADVGVAVGAGTQVAIDSADVVLTQSKPSDISTLIDLSFRTNRKMNQNLGWGAGYNFLAIPIAAGLLAPFGITISMAAAAILMSLSTVIVAINALSLNLN